jgi:2-oxoglutarate ferredoxin oxidoreductase subunit alpha
VTVKIGGEAGQGIQTVGQLLALVCQQAGLYVFGINDFESRIRGGHSFFQIRISDRQVRAPHQCVHLLVAMDRTTFEFHHEQVVPDGLTLMNESHAGRAGNVIPLALSELAQRAGSAITANTVAAGAALSLLGAPFELLQAVLRRQFKDKDSQVAEQNIVAARLGYEAAQNTGFTYTLTWNGRAPKGMLIDGSQALACGALAGDCRFAAFYPMSPSTSVMINLASWQDRFPLVVEQAEDEIAAVNMIIGASFAGVRSLTATSGGGFCLMTEGLGLAGITETPIVIINGQRPGPATGLATRTAQADLQFVIRAAQDEFPRFVFAPGSPEEAYTMTARALDLAEKYQCPAILLVDQYLNDSLCIVEGRFPVRERIERFLVDSSDADYQRYAFSESGISPRALPCRGLSLVKCSGNEHREDGHSTEAAHTRTMMVDKRGRKMLGMLAEMRAPNLCQAGATTLLAGWGSTRGVMEEAAEMLRGEGIDAGVVHFCDLWPFPAQEAYRYLKPADRLFVVEQNSTGQFAQLLRQETGLMASGMVLKYDGRPFYPVEICDQVKNSTNR